MKTFLKPALGAALAAASLAAPIMTAPAAAQSTANVGVVNLQAVIANSSAVQAANTQRQTTYATQLQQAETRRQALQAQLQPLVTAFNTARQQPNADQAALQRQAAQIQQLQQSGQAELQRILEPVALSQAYVEEQIEDKLQGAIEAAAKARGVTLVLTPDTVVYAAETLNMNQAVLQQLNSALPSVNVQPPAGWMPREMRAQQQAAAQAQAQQPAAAGR